MLHKQKYLPGAAIDAFRPHPGNANSGDNEAILESIENNGFFGAIIVQKSTGFILVGNHRWSNAQAAGMKKINALELDVDDDTAKRIMLADNRTARLGEDDPVKLLGLLQGLKDDTGTVQGTGYTEADLSALAKKAEAVEDPASAFSDEDNYAEQYGVIVLCKDAGEQEIIFNDLSGQGLECRVVVT